MLAQHLLDTLTKAPGAVRRGARHRTGGARIDRAGRRQRLLGALVNQTGGAPVPAAVGGFAPALAQVARRPGWPRPPRSRRRRPTAPAGRAATQPPRTSALIRPAMNASPAPTVSTTAIGTCRHRDQSPVRADQARAPRPPSVTTTNAGPRRPPAAQHVRRRTGLRVEPGQVLRRGLHHVGTARPAVRPGRPPRPGRASSARPDVRVVTDHGGAGSSSASRASIALGPGLGPGRQRTGVHPAGILRNPGQLGGRPLPVCGAVAVEVVAGIALRVQVDHRQGATARWPRPPATGRHRWPRRARATAGRRRRRTAEPAAGTVGRAGPARSPRCTGCRRGGRGSHRCRSESTAVRPTPGRSEPRRSHRPCADGTRAGTATVSGVKRVMLLDSASLYFRAFYGVPESVTAPDGMPVNAVRGFTDMVATLITRYRSDRLRGLPGLRLAAGLPGRVAAVLQGASGGQPDSGPGAGRRGGAGSAGAPGAGAARRCCEAAGLCAVGADGFEADDVIATLAARYDGVATRSMWCPATGT